MAAAMLAAWSVAAGVAAQGATLPGPPGDTPDAATAPASAPLAGTVL